MSEQANGRSALAWFEIPCADLDRGQKFYETLLGIGMKQEDFGDPNDVMCVFPAERPGIAGALVKRAFQRPSDQGTMIYLSCDGVLDETIGRVAGAGGSVIVPKTQISGGFGHFACIRDSEGNHVGLHSA
jgi:predicted enzyme related to lactoylglutathione lyase